MNQEIPEQNFQVELDGCVLYDSLQQIPEGLRGEAELRVHGEESQYEHYFLPKEFLCQP